MIIQIKRIFVKGEVTEGHLRIDGLQVCDTLENTFTCLSPGEYPVTLVKCKQYHRKMIIIGDTMTHVRIAPNSRRYIATP